MYYDGYYFLRWENGRNRGNTYNPWTTEELKVPDNLGIYNETTKKFIGNYDPRFSTHALTRETFTVNKT